MPLPRPRLKPVKTESSHMQTVRTAVLLGLVLSAAIITRMAVIRHTGYGYDLWLNTSWGYGGAQFGFANAYDNTLNGAFEPNYPPLTLLVYTFTAHVYQGIFSPDFDIESPVYRTLIKIPAMLADIGIVALLFFLFKKLRGERTAVIAGLTYALHPVAIVDGSIWGQTDSLYTFALLAAIVAAGRSEWMVCGALAAAGILLKAQAVILLPVLALIALADERRAAKMAIGGGLFAFIVLLPFAAQGNLHQVLDVYRNSVGTYPSLAQGAYNFWFALFGYESGREDTALFFNLLSYRQAGVLFFAGALAAMLLPYARSLCGEKKKPQVLLAMLLTGLTAQAFFLFTTEMHERYFFPFIVLCIPLLLTGGRGIFLYWSASILGLLNILSVMPLSPIDKTLFIELPNLPSFIAAAQVFIFVGIILHVRQQIAPELVKDLAKDFRMWLKKNIGVHLDN